MVVLTSFQPSTGTIPGKVLVVEEASGKTIRLFKFVAEFERDYDLLPVNLEIDDRNFPRAGRYAVEIHFSIESGEALKGEHPLIIVADEE